MARSLTVLDAGRAPYGAALQRQHELVERRLAGAIGDMILFVEHDPVVTVGRAYRGPALAPPGVEVVPVERGGEATYHGPGQIVAYPIVALEEGERDLHLYLRNLELAVIDAIEPLGVRGETAPGATGVWIAPAGGGAMRKVASIGVAVKRWVTYHGLALNVSTDLAGFRGFHPCGFSSDVMTTLESELRRAVDAVALRAALARTLAARLGRELAPARAAGRAEAAR